MYFWTGGLALALPSQATDLVWPYSFAKVRIYFLRPVNRSW